MGHNVYLFAGHPAALKPYAEISPLTRLYRLTPAAELVVMPLDDALQDDLHRRSGTGEWLDVVRLTSADMAFAARSSLRGAIAYVETDYADGAGAQAATLWSAGASAIRPLSLTTHASLGRPRSTWPINVVLRALGVVATANRDEFETFGLTQYRDNATIAQRAAPAP